MKDAKLYMSLSNNPNERGKLWKKYQENNKCLDLKLSDKLTSLEIYEIYKKITMIICAGLGVSPDKTAKEFDNNFLNRTL